MRKVSFDKDCKLPTAFFFILTVLSYIWQPAFAIIPAVLTIAVALFFRDPNRIIPLDEDSIVSPADGKVMGVSVEDKRDFFEGKVKKVTIFLSVLDVHINRSPIKGRVKDIRYHRGRFRAAFHDDVGITNERNMVFIQGDRFSVLVVQIAGLIARRIVCRVQEGTLLEKGERFGLIRFGSCTEVYLPPGAEVVVKEGQRVKAGQTIIGRWRGEQ